MIDPFTVGAARFMNCLPNEVTEDERQSFKEAFYATLGARGDARYCVCETPEGYAAEASCAQCGLPFKPMDLAALAKEAKRLQDPKELHTHMGGSPMLPPWLEEDPPPRPYSYGQHRRILDD